MQSPAPLRGAHARSGSSAKRTTRVLLMVQVLCTLIQHNDARSLRHRRATVRRNRPIARAVFVPSIVTLVAPSVVHAQAGVLEALLRNVTDINISYQVTRTN